MMMKRIITVVMMLCLFVGFSAQAKQKSSSKKHAKTSASGGFKSVDDVEEWLEGKVFVNSNGDELMYEDGMFWFSYSGGDYEADDEDSDGKTWDIKRGVAYTNCYQFKGNFVVDKKKNRVKVVPQVGDVEIFRLEE